MEQKGWDRGRDNAKINALVSMLGGVRELRARSRTGIGKQKEKIQRNDNNMLRNELLPMEA